MIQNTDDCGFMFPRISFLYSLTKGNVLKYNKANGNQPNTSKSHQFGNTLDMLIVAMVCDR